MFDLDGFAHDVLKKAKLITASGKEAVPMFFICKDETVGIMPLPYYVKDRDFHIGLMKSMLEAQQADAFVFAMEAWFWMPPKGFKAPIDLGNVPRPSQQPDKKEAIVIHGASREGKEVCLFVEIKRKGKKISFVEEQDMADGGPGKGLMALMSNMFGTEKVN
jgi:hypothetical protein